MCTLYILYSPMMTMPNANFPERQSLDVVVTVELIRKINYEYLSLSDSNQIHIFIALINNNVNNNQKSQDIADVDDQEIDRLMTTTDD